MVAEHISWVEALCSTIDKKLETTIKEKAVQASTGLRIPGLRSVHLKNFGVPCRIDSSVRRRMQCKTKCLSWSSTCLRCNAGHDALPSTKPYALFCEAKFAGYTTKLEHQEVINMLAEYATVDTVERIAETLKVSAIELWTSSSNPRENRRASSSIERSAHGNGASEQPHGHHFVNETAIL
eukprot:6321618-Amphidinium_carterae.1